jgi:hypothetical protein
MSSTVFIHSGGGGGTLFDSDINLVREPLSKNSTEKIKDKKEDIFVSRFVGAPNF